MANIILRNSSRDHTAHVRSADGDSISLPARHDTTVDAKFLWGLPVANVSEVKAKEIPVVVSPSVNTSTTAANTTAKPASELTL